jgi:3-oxoacyl-[acyl-carrier protein] reductase
VTSQWLPGISWGWLPVGRTALVTGGSRGIGYAVADRLLAGDVTGLVLTARTPVTLTRAARQLQAAHPGRTVAHHLADLADRDAVKGLAEAAMRLLGQVDILINNAGVAIPSPIRHIHASDLDYTMAVNVAAPLLLLQKLLAAGNTFDLVVNVASTAGITGHPEWATYSASKAALISMSAVMRRELAADGTRVVCVSPGRCATELRRVLAPDENQDRIMQPGHVADAMAALVADTGRVFDGQNLVIRLEA